MIFLFILLGVIIPAFFILTPGLWPALMIGNLTGVVPALVDAMNQLIAGIFGG